MKKVELYLKELTSELEQTDDSARQMEIIRKIGEYNKARIVLNTELGRV